MKKIISGKLYDTETARLIGTYANPGSWRDFNHYEESLFQKRNGEYFIHGEGGANSRYAKAVDANSWSGGEEIRPQTYDSAREWAEKYLDADEYLKEFTITEDEEELFSVQIKMSAATKKRLDICQAKTGKPYGQILAELLKE